jgi:predicted amidohydrolase YtcJ
MLGWTRFSSTVRSSAGAGTGRAGRRLCGLAGLARARCDLSPVSGREASLRAISTYAGAHPEVEWILGGGWHQPDYPGGTPAAADLDAVVGDRPVFLVNADHHDA